MRKDSLLDIWELVCNKYANFIAFENLNGEKISYQNAYKRMIFLSKKFKELGIERFDHASIFARNSINWLIIEQAIICNGGVCIAKSPEVGINELNFVFSQSDSNILVIDNSSILKSFLDIDKNFLNKIKFVLVLEDEVDVLKNNNVYYLNELLSDFSLDTEHKIDLIQYPNDIAYISYTSGTSSKPKGAMIKNSSMAFLISRLCELKKASPNKKSVCTCHISSMGWKAECLSYWAMGCSILFIPYNEFYNSIEKIKPTYFQIPPKILQTIHSKLIEKLNNKSSFFNFLFKITYKIAENVLTIQHTFIKNNLIYILTQLLLKLFDILLLKKIRHLMFESDVLFDVGSAPLSQNLENFYRIIGIKIIQSYGSTEMTGIAIANTIESQRKHPYTVGIPLKDIELKIVEPETFKELRKNETGLILIKGPIVFEGYYKNIEETNKSLLKDYYLNTGDLGFINDDGYLKILSRNDDVLVLSNGYNIYTRLLENEVKDSEYINQIVIIGHAKPYLCALIVINISKYKSWCLKNNELSDNVNNNKFKNFLLKHLNEKIQRKENFKYYEKIKNIYLIKEDFTITNGLLAANTMKILYKKVYQKYQKQINEMYKGVI